MLRVALALALTACHATPGDSGAGDTAAEPCGFSFAILTDTHLGEGAEDHGTAGWDDGGGDGGANAAILADAIAEVEALAAERGDLRFAVVLGDLTDSGERSELEAVRALLEASSVPMLPLLGNHDTWPYAWAGDHWDEAPEAQGDALLLEVFDALFAAHAAEFPSLVRAAPTVDPDTGAARPFVNWALDVCGTHLVALDTSTRVHAGDGYPGVGPEASLHDHAGGTWPWLQDELLATESRRILVFSHHPFVGAGAFSFTGEDMAAVEAFLDEHDLGSRVGAFFAGHIHLDSVLEGPAGVPVVLSAATKDGRSPLVVTVTAQGEVAWQ